MKTSLQLEWVPMRFGVLRESGECQPRLLGQFRRGELIACKMRDGDMEWRREANEDAWTMEVRIISDLRAMAWRVARIEAAE